MTVLHNSALAKSMDDAVDSILFNPQLTEQEKVANVLDVISNSVSSDEKKNIQLKKTLHLARKNELLEQEITLLSSIARISIFLQEFDSVYYYSLQSIDLLEKNKQYDLIAEPVGYIMSGYYYQDRYQDAIDVFNANKNYYSNGEINDSHLQLYYSAALNYEQLDKVDSTVYFLNKIMNDLDPNTYFDQHLNVTAVLLAIYSENEFDQEADALVADILDRKKHIKDSINILSIYMSLGQHFHNQKKYELAKKYLNEALEISIEKGFIGESAGLYSNLYNIEKEQGNYAEALYAFEQFKLFQDSINNVEIQIATQEFEEKYQNDKLRIENLEKTAAIKTEEAERLTAEAEAYKSKRNLTYTIMVLILVVILAAYWINIVRNRRKEDAFQASLSQAATERELAENQLRALRSQMNPHFVFNAVNSIQELILKEDTIGSYNSLITFSQLVRNTLEYSSKEFIELENEIEYLELYLTLEKLRFTTDFSYNIICHADPACLVPSIIIQPFVENAIKHGLFHKKGMKNLEIIFRQDNHLICEIIDNGIGRQKAQEIAKRRKRDHNSFSTAAIARRMEILANKYDGDVYYEIEDLVDETGQARGTKVTVHLPNVF